MTDDVATTDRLLGGRVLVRQPRHGFRAAIDAVMLAAAVEARDGERALDLGCGTGAAMFCLAVRCPGVRVVGLDADAALVGLAREGIALNGLQERAAVAAGDVTALPAALAEGAFDHVLMNPPFHDRARGRAAPGGARESAKGEAAPLARWVEAAAGALGRGGRLTLVWRADRLDAAIGALEGRLGSLALLPLWPKSGKAAARIVVMARKGGRAPLRLLPGMVLHRSDGQYTDEAQAVLRDAAALSWTAGAPIIPAGAGRAREED